MGDGITWCKKVVYFYTVVERGGESFAKIKENKITHVVSYMYIQQFQSYGMVKVFSDKGKLNISVEI